VVVEIEMKHYLITLIVFAIIVTGIVIGIVMFCHHSANYTLDQSNFTTNALALVEKHTSLSLPVGSRGLNMVYRGFEIDPSFVAKIEIPSNAGMLLKSQIEKIKDEDYHPIGALSEKTSWWKPVKSDTIVERKYTVDSSYAHLILCQENSQFVLFVESISF
jgi:hypothetical protein